MNLPSCPIRALLTACLVALCSSVLAEGPPIHWNYKKGSAGPEHWGELDPAFEACGQGSYQSPIDIRDPVRADLPALQFQYNDAKPAFSHTGRTIEVKVPAGNFLVHGNMRYELQNFHFHTPSEEAFNGKRAEMVAHFVHKNASGQLLVLAVLMQEGKTNAAYEPIFAHLPHPGESITVADLNLSLGSLLPNKRSYYTYVGSLTTPPCSEGIRWIVMRQTVKVSAKQIKAFRKLFKANARPVQALNDRKVQASD